MGRRGNVLARVQRNRINRICVYIYKEKFILRYWLTKLWRLASPKYVGQTDQRPKEGFS